MYRIKAKNLLSGVIFYEYGFSSFMMETLHYMFNDTDDKGYSIYEVMEVSRLCFSLETFEKCLTNYTYMI